MKVLAFFSAMLLSVAAPQCHIDLSYYYRSPAAERDNRRHITDEVHAFLRSRVSEISSPQQLNAWLDRYDGLLEALEKDDVYVYLRAEENDADTSDARADVAIAAEEDALAAHVDQEIKELGCDRALSFAAVYAPLARYRYFILSAGSRAAHAVSPDRTRGADATLAATRTSYKKLRKHVIAAQGKDATAFAPHQEAFASMLVTIATANDAIAHVRGFRDAVEAAYFDRSLTSASVDRVLAAVRASDAYRRYDAVQGSAAAKRFASTPVRHMPIDAALTTIVAAERPMGSIYSDAFADLLNPRNGRLELCTDPACDNSGFSLGFAGIRSALFVGGSYVGNTNDVRKIAHEAAHAVHRELMSEHQPIAVYNLGPQWMFESFAIFNELLLFDHLYATTDSPAERAYYAKAFLDDATFNVFGSAEETELEAHLQYAIAARSARTAADFDAITLRVFARYDPLANTLPGTRYYWARDSLYFTDPLYDVNYLYAGLLALRYLDDFERDPSAFSRRYVALLENGFTEPPAGLERRFLGIDITDERGLVRTATTLIDRRTAALNRLYKEAESEGAPNM